MSNDPTLAQVLQTAFANNDDDLNVVDQVAMLKNAVDRVAESISYEGKQYNIDAWGNRVHNLSDAVLSVSVGLKCIADAIDGYTAMARNRHD